MTNFSRADLTAYAENYISPEVRRGIALLGFVSLLLLGTSALLYASLGFGSAYVYTFSLLALLALHIGISSKGIKTTEMLYLLGMVLLIIAGSAFVLLAHKTGSFSAALLSSTVLLFMLVPLVPWGMREATAVVSLIYLVFTLSTVTVQGRFDREALWLLQFLMLGSAMTSLTVVARNVAIRKKDIQSHFDLENAHKEMELLSYKDPLTGAWNRRFLDKEFNRLTKQFHSQGQVFHFALIDVNEFKQLNDTYGHDCGDMVLQYISQVFMHCFQSDASFIRLGGDEFVVLFGGDEPDDLMRQAFDALQNTGGLSGRLFGLDENIPVHISTGLITVNPEQSVSLKVLYKEADKALYTAKAKSKQVGIDSQVVCRVHSGASTG